MNTAKRCVTATAAAIISPASICLAIRTGVQPFPDVYRAVDMTIVGILGYRSALENSTTFTVPDFANAKSATNTATMTESEPAPVPPRHPAQRPRQITLPAAAIELFTERALP